MMIDDPDVGPISRDEPGRRRLRFRRRAAPREVAIGMVIARPPPVFFSPLVIGSS